MTADLLSFTEAAGQLGMGRRSFYAWAKRDDFPFPVVMIGTVRRIPTAAVDFYALYGRAATSDELFAHNRALAEARAS